MLTIVAIRFAEGPITGLDCIRGNMVTWNLDPGCVGGFSLENRQVGYGRRVVIRWIMVDLWGCYVF